MKRRRKKRVPTLMERAGYAVVGFVSGILLSILTVVPAFLVYLRLTGAIEHYWALFVLPFCLAALTAAWGFLSTDGMVETMSSWWNRVMELYSR